MQTTINDCKIIRLPQEEDPRGSLTYIYENQQVPFPIRRVFYIYDVPAGKDRGAHAHRECWQFIIAASGALEVYVSDGENEKTYTLNRPYQGLLIPPGIWAQEREFSSGALCLVLASHEYSEADYIRSYSDYLDYRKTIG
ncbi:MAG: WxcM-like domain-containing protein [Prevotella sp.]|nr:WxcM-like domain-containing protein [Prevotella sp.]MBR6191699.1 WxcM-like domain-containing protein [Prevotella sp.]